MPLSIVENLTSEYDREFCFYLVFRLFKAFILYIKSIFIKFDLIRLEMLSRAEFINVAPIID